MLQVVPRGMTLKCRTGPAGPDLDAREEVDWIAQNWKILMPQLEAFAIGRLKGKLPRVAEAKDLVQQAVAKTIGKERRWRSERCTLFSI